MGKAYANRKLKIDRPINDFYQTPKCLTWELLKTGLLNNCKTILDPCCGKGAISNILKENSFIVDEKDISTGNDFLTENYNKRYDAIVMNPPFDLWNEFVNKAKTIANKVIVLGRLNYFGTKRNQTDIWKHLQYIYVYNRQVAYDKQFREDGKIYCGCLVTGWFVYNMEYNNEPIVRFMDVDKYVVKKI